MKIRRIIQDYFTFNKSERIAIVSLVVIILILIIVRHFIFYFETPGKADIEQFDFAVKEMMKHQKGNYMEGTPRKLFTFDPNKIDSLAIDSLDLPIKVKGNFFKYRKTGGTFKTVESFKKIYGVNDSIFDIIRHYIKIDIEYQDQGDKFVEKGIEEKSRNKLVYLTDEKNCYPVELNTADSIVLKKIKGIGDKLSIRIIKYRNLLGGFYSKEQLSEVYGLSQTVLEELISNVIVDTTKIKKMDINFSDKKALLRHPYLSYKQVDNIIKYRNMYGFMDRISVLVDSMIIGENEFKKLRPYITTEHLQKFVKKAN